MSSEFQQLAHSIFLQAIELDKNEQIKFVKEKTQGNNQIYEYIMNLVSSHDSSNEFFHELEKTIFETHLNEIEEHHHRDVDFGKYQIINVIKQGGMGTIFLAQRSDGEFERKVVIKMIPIDLSNSPVLNQFAHEKEILASLIHPNIVQLYDSGVTEKGEPYFIIELIQGTTLINYCNKHQLNLKQRLDIFQLVLQAVAHAHQHLVIHGDIKPSNIMVSNEGQVKLLDFGIAKMIYQNDTDIQGYCLDYLTPEHKQKQTVITTTDIHQLGQLLFEILTGIPPTNIRSNNFEFPALKTITRNPQWDKQKLLNDTNSNLSTIKKVYKSDLSVIVAKALKKEPENRYKTVQEFSEDIKHYFKNHCIQALPHTFVYKSKKYMQRHKFFSLSLLIAVLMTSILLWQLRHHNQILKLERDKAITVKNLMTDVFSVADPSYTPGKELSATEILDIGLRRVRERFIEHSEIETELLEYIARTYQSLGNYQKANEVLLETFEISNQLFPENQLIKAKNMLLLGENYRLMSDNNKAKKWLSQSLEIFNRDKNKNINFIASAKSKLGRVMVLLGDIQDAEVALNDATRLTLEFFGENSYEYAQVLNDLSSVYFRQGKYEEVQKLLSQTKFIRENLLLNQENSLIDKDYATNINNLGLAYYLQGNLIKGEEHFRQANILRNKIYSKPHPEQAQSLTNLGLLLNDSGRAKEAFPYLQEALKIRQLTLTPRHMLIYDAWNNLAMTYHEINDFVNADAIYQNIFPEVLETRGETHPQAISIMNNWANTLLELNEFEKAQEMFQKSLELRQQTLPKNHLYLSYSYIGLGRAKVALTQVEEGKELIRQGLEIRKQKLPKAHWLNGEALYAFAMANYSSGSFLIDETSQGCEILNNSKGENYHLTQKCKTLLSKLINTPL